MTRLLLILCVLFYIKGVSCQDRMFPPGFKFGASTSAYQIEGAWNADGKGVSVWDFYTHLTPSIIKDRSNGDIATDSYHKYKRDVEMAKELGLHFYRFSISWTRILPDGVADRINQAGIDYYNDFIDELLRNNIEPFVTIYHFDMPEYFKKLGGWTNSYIIDGFLDYAKVLFDNFGSKVRYWVTINEPRQACYYDYYIDSRSSKNTSEISEYICTKNILIAHAKAYRLYERDYRKLYNGSVGIVINCVWFDPASDSEEDRQAAEEATMFNWGIYANPIFSSTGDFPVEVKRIVQLKSAEQGFPTTLLPRLSKEQVEMIKGSSDFFGMNVYYTAKLVTSHLDDTNATLVNKSTWEQAHNPWPQAKTEKSPEPSGFKKILSEVKRLYNNPPVYITENGLPTAGGLLDYDRIRYLRSYLAAMLDGVGAGSDVRGYFVWSLMDNFQWQDGYTSKYGLYEVDFASPERTRTPRKSAVFYKEVIKTNSLVSVVVVDD